MGVVLAVDAGTTGVRSLAVDESGNPVGWRYCEFPQHFPRPGWVEHDPIEIWDAVRATLVPLIEEVRASGHSVAGIGITNQRETALAWDRRSGVPYHRAIVWQDRRTADRCGELASAGHLPMIREQTGLVLDPYFSATKFEWLLRDGGVAASDPNLVLGTVDAWLVWNLTGGEVLATDASNASRTMLYDIDRLAWSESLCAMFGVPVRALPEVVASSGRIGTTSAKRGVPAGIPVSGIAGDQQAALFGQACFEPGMTKNTYGTGSFVLMNVGARRPSHNEGTLTTIAWQIDGTTTYALEGAVFVTGAAIQWLRDGLGLITSADEVGPLAASVPDSAGVYIVPAFAGLGSPWWDPYARGTIVGITRGTGRAQLARAVVESMAYQTRDVVEAMRASSGRPVTILRVDGGASVMDLLLQLQAEQLQLPVARPTIQETTALGAAYLAGLAENVWSSLAELGTKWRLEAEFRPTPGLEPIADILYAEWRRAVERSLGWES